MSLGLGCLISLRSNSWKESCQISIQKSKLKSRARGTTTMKSRQKRKVKMWNNKSLTTKLLWKKQKLISFAFRNTKTLCIILSLLTKSLNWFEKIFTQTSLLQLVPFNWLFWNISFFFYFWFRCVACFLWYLFIFWCSSAEGMLLDCTLGSAGHTKHFLS